MTNEEVLQAINGVLSSTLNYDDSIEYQLTIDDIEWLEDAKMTYERFCRNCGAKMDEVIE